MGDARCIRRTAQIVQEAARERPVAAVVSAMSGVTNRLIQAAKASEVGDLEKAIAIFGALRQQHASAIDELIVNRDRREQLTKHLDTIFDEGERLCRGTALLFELTSRTLDAISSLGERLSAPIVAGALVESGARSEAVEATELIVTDSSHGEPIHSWIALAPVRKRGCGRSCSKG